MAYPSMNEAALRAEIRTFTHIDMDLLKAFALACQTIGPELREAFEGEQRTVFEELWAYVVENNIQPATDLPLETFSQYQLILSLSGAILASLALPAPRRVVRASFQWTVSKAIAFPNHMQHHVQHSLRPIQHRIHSHVYRVYKKCIGRDQNKSKLRGKAIISPHKSGRSVLTTLETNITSGKPNRKAEQSTPLEIDVICGKSRKSAEHTQTSESSGHKTTKEASTSESLCHKTAEHVKISESSGHDTTEEASTSGSLCHKRTEHVKIPESSSHGTTEEANTSESSGHKTTEEASTSESLCHETAEHIKISESSGHETTKAAKTSEYSYLNSEHQKLSYEVIDNRLNLPGIGWTKW